MSKRFFGLFSLLLLTLNAFGSPLVSPNLTAGKAVLSERMKAATRAVVNPAAYNRTAGTTYANLKAALAALNGQTATQNILIEWEGDQLCQGAVLNTLNMGNYTLTIRPVGYIVGGLNNPRYVLDVGGAATCVTFNNSGNNNLGNIKWYGGRINNFLMNSGACKAISGLGTKGSCLISDVEFTNGAIPIRWVGTGAGTTASPYIPCGNLTIEDVTCTHGYGAFRLGLGIASTYRDFGAVTIRRCNTRWDRRYQTDAALAAADDNAPASHVVMALKNFTSLLIEDCNLEGAGKSLIAIENTENVIIRRCDLRNSGILNTSGGTVDYQAKSGFRSNMTIEACKFIDNQTGIIYGDGSNAVAGTGALVFRQNLIVEHASANRNIIYLANGLRFAKNYNNIYYLNSTATAVVVNFGTAVSGTAADWNSDYNTWYKTSTTRSLIGGTINGTSVAATSLAQLQTQGQTGDPAASTRDLHSDGNKPVFNKDN